MTAAAKERNCISQCREETESKKMPMWTGMEDVVFRVRGIVFEILSLPIYMNDDRKFKVAVSESYPVIKFFSEDAVKDMLTSDSRGKAIKMVDEMIFDKMVMQRAYQALVTPMKKLHGDNLYMDFEKTRNAWSRGGPVVQVDQALLQLANDIPVDIYNRRFLDRLDHQVFLNNLEFVSLQKGQRFREEEMSADALKFEAV